MIRLLLSLLVLLIGGLISPSTKLQYTGPSPVVFTHPIHLTTNRPARLLVAGLERGTSHVTVFGLNGSWAAAPAAHGAFVARAFTPRNAGSWVLRIRFRLHGHSYTVLGAVFEVDPR